MLPLRAVCANCFPLALLNRHPSSNGTTASLVRCRGHVLRFVGDIMGFDRGHVAKNSAAVLRKFSNRQIVHGPPFFVQERRSPYWPWTKINLKNCPWWFKCGQNGVYIKCAHPPIRFSNSCTACSWPARKCRSAALVAGHVSFHESWRYGSPASRDHAPYRCFGAVGALGAG
jgi:hypothetical protein